MSQLNHDAYSKLGTNVINDLGVSANKATGSLVVDKNGNVEMNIIINDKCYKKSANDVIRDIEVESIDDCVNLLATIPPDRCFDTEDIEGGLKISKYKCGNSNTKNENYYRTIDKYNSDGEYTNIMLPAKINNKPVLEIGNGAFCAFDDDGKFIEGNKVGITNVIIPSSVTSIGEYAFEYNQLKNATIPKGVINIGFSAFYGNQLKNIDIPDSVTNIDQAGFGDNQLTNVVIENGTKTIGDRVFSYNQITSVTIPDSVIEIGFVSFYYNKLLSIDILNSVKKIGTSSFASNNDIIFNVDNSSGSIEGDPWGASKVNYLR